MELICPAGSLPALKSAIDHGADAVYLGFKNETNARHFAGLNFDPAKMEQALRYAHERGKRVFLALNTYAQNENFGRWREAVDEAVALGIDALIIADFGVMDYAAERWPDTARHLSVQGSATNYEAIDLFHRQFAIRRVVLPRVLSLAQVKHVVEHSPVEIEIFGFGSLCVMVEGRCLLSSFATGDSPNTFGACSPAHAVEWKDLPNGGQETRLGGVLIDRRGADESAGYPTLCKGRFNVASHTYYAIEEPTSLNTLGLLPELQAAGVAAIKIEGRQRSPAYVAQVAKVWRAALDDCARDPERYTPRPDWMATLGKVSEGAQTTLGAYHRPWH